MKQKFLFLAVAATMAMSSCSNDEVISEQQNAIGFEVLTTKANKPSTYATEMTTSLLRTFNVWGYYHATASTDYSGTPYIDVDPSRASSSDEFEYSPLKYWPAVSGSEIDFFAVTPKTYTTRGTGASNSMPFTCTVGATAAAQEDLLFAQTFGADSTNGGGTHGDATGGDALTNPAHNGRKSVVLHFHHALSQIKFEARSASSEVKFIINSISLKTVMPDGSVDIATWTPKATDPANGGNGLVWTASGTEVDYAYSLKTDSVKYSTSTYTNITGTDGTLMLIPQATTAMTVEINYDAFDNASGIQLVDDATKTIPAGTSANQFADQVSAWLPGVTYTYRLTINPDALVPILFDAEVEAWADGTNTDVTI